MYPAPVSSIHVTLVCLSQLRKQHGLAIRLHGFLWVSLILPIVAFLLLDFIQDTTLQLVMSS